LVLRSFCTFLEERTSRGIRAGAVCFTVSHVEPYANRLAAKHDLRCREQLPGYCAAVQVARDRRRQHRVARRDYAPTTAARGYVVVQPADPVNQGGAAHCRGARCRPGSVGRSPGGLDVLLAVTACLRAGTGALLAGVWATGSWSRGAVQSAGLSRTAPGQDPVDSQARQQRASGHQSLSRPGRRGERSAGPTSAALPISLGRCLRSCRQRSRFARNRRRLSVTITAYPRSINHPCAAWATTASQPTNARLSNSTGTLLVRGGRTVTAALQPLDRPICASVISFHY